MWNLELMEAAGRIVKEVAVLQPGDEVLVVTDAATWNIGKALASASRLLGAETVLALMPMTGEHGNEPPATIAAAMAAADVVFAPTTHAITHTRARLAAHAAGARVVILRGVDEDMMIKGAMAADFKEVKRITAKVAEAFNRADRVHVTSVAGTNVTLSTAGRRFFRLDGLFQEEMGFAALPGGECPTAPREGTTQGRIVIDYSMDGIGRLRRPLVLEVEKGRVASIEGSPSEAAVLERFFAQDESARNIAEFSIGTNPAARLSGNLAEDKKLLGSVHFAIGDNRSLGGSVESTIHLDGLILEPTITVDKEKPLVQMGKLLF
jgi:leucyl aminopeptidase (aminopeptidase T)